MTGGVEDGVLQELLPISEKFTTVVAFGNVHGVYKAGNVKFQPESLAIFQKFASLEVGRENPLFSFLPRRIGSQRARRCGGSRHWRREDERGHWRAVGALGGNQELP